MGPFDVAIVGAGSAGAATARQLARRGLRVFVGDKRPRQDAGARWVNAVPDWMFARADVAAPEGAERRSHGERYVLASATGTTRVEVPRCPTTFLDMRLLIARLQDDAIAAGAVIEGGLAVDAVDVVGRDQRLHLSGQGRQLTVRARLVVDATGMRGAVRSLVPALSRRCPPVQDRDICLAAQEVRTIADVEGARRFLDDNRLNDRDAFGVVGLAGGFSTRLVIVDLARGEVDLLCGAIAGGRFPSGARLLQDFVAAEPWIGERLFGGAGAIPLRRPWDTLGTAGVALVGDAASMVFPAHGSGVGAGLIAARLLGDAVAAGTDPGSPAVIRRYSQSFHQELGSLCVAYDAFRRATQDLSADELTALMAAGFLNEHTTGDALAQVMPGFALQRSLALGRAALRAPRLAKTMAPTVGRMLLAHAVASRFPASARLAPWVGRGLDRLVGG